MVSTSSHNYFWIYPEITHAIIIFLHTSKMNKIQIINLKANWKSNIKFIELFIFSRHSYSPSFHWRTLCLNHSLNNFDMLSFFSPQEQSNPQITRKTQYKTPKILSHLSMLLIPILFRLYPLASSIYAKWELLLQWNVSFPFFSLKHISHFT